MAKLLHEDEYALLIADAERYRFIREHHERVLGEYERARLTVVFIDWTGPKPISIQPGALDAIIDKGRKS